MLLVGVLPPPSRNPAELLTRDVRAAASAVELAPTDGGPSCIARDRCCKVCVKGKACGNTCIKAEYQCHKGRGCACDADDVCE